MSFLRQRSLTVSALFASLFLFRGAIARGDTHVDDDDNFREDVIECEQAASHLKECCGTPASQPDCHYYHYESTNDCGCMSSGTESSTTRDDRPIPIEDSKAIQNASCADLASQGYCEKIWPDNSTSSSSEGECY